MTGFSSGSRNGGWHDNVAKIKCIFEAGEGLEPADSMVQLPCWMGARGRRVQFLVVFIHANGFPPASYDSILENLKNNYKVGNFLLRPLWKDIPDYRNLKSWTIFCEDFEKFLNIVS